MTVCTDSRESEEACFHSGEWRLMLTHYGLCKHLTHDLTADIGETEVAAHVPIREACVIESETVQHEWPADR